MASLKKHKQTNQKKQKVSIRTYFTYSRNLEQSASITIDCNALNTFKKNIV